MVTSRNGKQALVGILMGSDSDLPMMSETGKTLDKFGIEFEMNVMSAHRTPALAHEYATSAQKRGLKVLIAAAGAAAHLAGVIAANTTLPVIGVPMGTSSLNGLDALLSTVQMPGGIPVATMAIDKAGAVNAAIFAAEILGLSDEKIAQKLVEHKAELARGVEEKNARLQEQLAART
jgi:phosphoribosylaminoimidazole carboxylase PurE protein